MAIPEMNSTTSQQKKETSPPAAPAAAPGGTARPPPTAGGCLQQQASDDEEKCLLTPTSLQSTDPFEQNDEVEMTIPAGEHHPLPDSSAAGERGVQQESVRIPPTHSSQSCPLHHFQQQPLGGEDCSTTGEYFLSLNSPLIYSEPALSSAFTNGALAGVSWAYSDMALPQADTNPATMVQPEVPAEGGEEQQAKEAVPGGGQHKAARAVTPKSSCFFSSESQPSIATGASVFLPHKQSFSIGEIRDTHMQIQKRYRPSRRRHYTDPVDFEGILNIIGGCSWWQIWVYLLISLQQIPHAMFNLSVVYMMYQPDHWCKIPGVNSSSNETSAYLWDVSDALQGSVVYPRTRNKQRDMLNFHSQCHYYDRGEERYDQLRRMPLDEAQRLLNESDESVDMRKCQEWYYDNDVMRSTIVTEWNLVCDDNFKRAHAHLFYSFGFLFGCLLGGFASDRFGRKPTVIGFGILSSLFGLLLPYSSYFPMFLFIRFCGAVCNEAADLAAYVLCMEITGTRYRAMVGSLLQAPWAVGYATLALIAYFCKSWQNIQLITAALHTLSICLICVLPESPRWLIVNNRVDEAERYIRRACRKPPFPFSLFKFNKSSLPCDLELVKHAEQRKWVRRDQRANILHLLKSRALCMRTGVICVVWIATALVYYGIIIALSDQSAPGRVLFSGNFFLNNAVAGAIELPTLIFCVYLMKYGRKRSQIFTLVGAAIFIMLAMASMSANNTMLSLGLMLLGKIFIQGGFNILYIFTSELYPTVIRNSAVGFCSMIARFGSGVSSYIAILSDVTLSIVPMIIFATFSLFAGTLVMLLPETRDQPLPDTLQDAVVLLKNEERTYQCRGFGTKFLGGKYSVSATELMQQQNETEREAEESECGGGGAGGEGTSSTCGGCGPEEGDEAGGDDDDEDADGGNVSASPSPAAERSPRKRSDTTGPSGEAPNCLPSIPEEESQRRVSADTDDRAGSGTAKTGAGSPSLLISLSSTSSASSSGSEEGEPDTEVAALTRVRHRAGCSERAEAGWKLSAEFGASQKDFVQAVKDEQSSSSGQTSGNSMCTTTATTSCQNMSAGAAKPVAAASCST